jgi:5-formyltetrahydrofolate cyclo-ligase
MISKQGLRNTMRRRLEALSPQEYTRAGLEAASRICGLPCWDRCGTVLLFLSTDREIDTGPLLDLALSREKRVFLPKVRDDGLRFFRTRTASGPWQEGAFHIREPPAGAPGDLLGPADFPALIVVPGMAFDRRGNRLGRGKGFYDRFFAELDSPAMPAISYFTVGFCLEIQIVPLVPVENQDKRMDFLCTGENLFSCFENGEY